MSSSTTPTVEKTSPTPSAPWPNWVREPLLHFAALGALLFAADHFIAARADDPRTIIVGAEVDKEARETFKSARGREPDAKELAALRSVWLDNEVLYREGMALRVDLGDTAIRERVIFKALSIVDSNLRLPAVDEKTLRAWFEAHRDRYDEPGRYDFQEAILAGENTEAAVTAFVAELNSAASGDAKAALRIFKGRPLSNLAHSYGPEFPKALDRMSAGTWHALPTSEGWRAIRLDAIAAGKAAVFEAVRGAVQQDWVDDTMAAQRTAAVRELAKKYRIKSEDGRPWAR